MKKIIDNKIFDKNGKALHIVDVISRFLNDKAEHHNVMPGNVMIRSFSKGQIDIDEIEGLEDISFNHIETI